MHLNHRQARLSPRFTSFLMFCWLCFCFAATVAAREKQQLEDLSATLATRKAEHKRLLEQEQKRQEELERARRKKKLEELVRCFLATGWRGDYFYSGPLCGV